MRMLHAQWNSLCSARFRYEREELYAPMNPKQLSHELRNTTTPDLTRRRWIIGLSVLSAAAGQIVTLYQTGIIKHLPDPPLAIFDSDKVDASNYAYKRANAPDAPVMIATYGITAWLASMGGKNRAAQNPWLPIAMGVKTVIDAVTALELGREEWQENKKFCAYCQTATIASLASVALAVPEVLSAIRTLRSGSTPPVADFVQRTNDLIERAVGE